VEYTSRLHYFSNWIANNTRNGFVMEIQKNSSPFTAIQIVNTNYMTNHVGSYLDIPDANKFTVKASFGFYF
jgi:hypothetical protein